MPLRLLLAAALLPAPAFATTVMDSHVELAVPAGRTPVKIYRPKVQDSAAPRFVHRQTGKLPIAPPTPITKTR